MFNRVTQNRQARLHAFEAKEPSQFRGYPDEHVCRNSEV